MPSINMIAARGAERKRLEKMISITLLIIAAEVAVMFFLLGFMTTRAFSASREIDRLDKELAKVEPTVVMIQDYEAQIEKLTPRLYLLADSREQTLLWYTVMHGLARSMPEQTWLSNITTTRPSVPASGGNPAPTTINLRGVSISQALVGETMLRLNQFPEFQRIDLSYTQKNDSRARECVEFQVTALLSQNEPEEGGKNNVAKN